MREDHCSCWAKPQIFFADFFYVCDTETTSKWLRNREVSASHRMTRPAEGDPEQEGSSGMLGGNGGVAVRPELPGSQ